jgi:hypothetical protein
VGILSAQDPQPPPIMSPDGKHRWDGYRWVSVLTPIPWQVKAAEVLVLVEAAAIGFLGVLLIVGIGALGLLANADNGGSGLPAVGHTLGLLFLATLAMVGLLIAMAILMARKRWARWVIVAIQALFLAYAVGDTIYYLAVVRGPGVQTNPGSGVVLATFPLLVIVLLLHPASRRAMLS